MADKPFPPPSSSQYHPASQSSSGAPAGESGTAAGEPGTRSIGQRSSDARDAMTEMAERAQLISQEAGTKIAAAMKDVIGTAAGMAGFAVESARDLVQFMVRRGQLTQDEADKLIREAEQAHGKRGGRSAASEPAKEPVQTKSSKKQNAKRESAAKKPSSKPASKKRR